MNHLFQFHSRDLFAVVLIVGLTLSFVSGETPPVALATVFCFFSCIGLPMAIWVSGKDLFRTLGRVYQYRRIGLLGGRIKWLMAVDGGILVWLLLSVAVANFVLENYMDGAKTMLLIGLVVGPVIAIALLCRFGKTNSLRGSVPEGPGRINSRR